MNLKTSHTCSTFLLSTAEALLVDHNLDDYTEMPGQVIANLRGIAKEKNSRFSAKLSEKI